MAVDDANSDDAFDPLADQAVSVSTTDADHAVNVSTTNDDTAGFTVTESGGTSVSETGTTDTFTVVLDRQPTTDVVLTVASEDTGEATLSPGSLTFTPANWNRAQTVTATGVADALTDGTQTTTIAVSVVDANSDDTFDPLADQTLSVSTTDDSSSVDDANSDDAFDSLANQTVSMSTTDDEGQGSTVTEVGGSTSGSDTGTTDTVTLVFGKEPTTLTAPTTHTAPTIAVPMIAVPAIASGETGEAALSPGSPTATNANENNAQTVPVTAVDETPSDGTQTTATVPMDDANRDNAIDTPAADGLVATNDESAGFTVVESDGFTEVSEAGTFDDFTVVLNAQPITNVVIDITTADPGEVLVSPKKLTFTTANWDTAQTVSVLGRDDADIDGPQTTAVTVAVNVSSTDDPDYDLVPAQVVSVTTTDNDSPSFTVAESGGSTSVSETGTTDTFTLVLGLQPASDVVLTVAVRGCRRSHGQPRLADVHDRELEPHANRDRDRRRRRPDRRDPDDDPDRVGGRRQQC